MRILVAEDDPVSQKVITVLLKEYGECIVASNGDEALRQFELAARSNTPFDLLVLDILMPGLSGIQVLEAVRKFEAENDVARGDQAKVVMATGLGDEENFMKAHAAGSTWFITKPIDRDALRTLMQDLGF